MNWWRVFWLFVVAVASPVQAAPAPEFTVVVLPDTQVYSFKFPETFAAQVDWIIANRTNLNIAYVAHLGDITESGDLNPKEWQVATNALYRLLDAGIPLGVVPGNHDHYGGTKLYDQFFGPHLFEKRPWYGGNLGGNNRNHFDRFSVGNLDFLVVYNDFFYHSLDYGPIDAWTSAVLASNANRRAILVSHCLLEVTGEFDPRGRQIYDNVKTHTNLFLMLCGHNHGQAHRADTHNGHTIHTCLSDFQADPLGGSGLLRLYRFSPRENLIRVQTYSPTLNKFLTDTKSQFQIGYPMNPDAPVPSGTPLAKPGSKLAPKPPAATSATAITNQ